MHAPEQSADAPNLRSKTQRPFVLNADELSESVNNFNAACARTLTRGLALYFSRPVRLFRPAKVTGWQFLKNVAQKEGSLLTPSYFLQLCKAQGVWVVPKHFLPPMLVNAALGTVLWTSYGGSYAFLVPTTGQHSLTTAALAGAFAGGCQALLAAPAENVRLLLEGGSKGHSTWSCVWKEIFQSRTPPPAVAVRRDLQEIRELRTWLKDVGEMAGRGWDGWRWGCAKDICAFAAFFSIFETTRRASSCLKRSTHDLCNYPGADMDNIPKIVNAMALITGGVLAGLVHETVSQPWDRIRRIIHLYRSKNPDSPNNIPSIVVRAVREQGVMSLIRDPISLGAPHITPQSASVPPWFSSLVKTLARVGPWGVGFLVWEAYGPGLG